ncbi:MAG TPA: hypothetical protein VIM77_02900, partial [Mucilaginibacter sp.]
NVCPVEITAKYISKTFAVTDLDKNGEAEVWLMYATTCRGDVSPANLKIIMHEADKKYAMRGTSRSPVTDKDWMGGEYTFDEAFKSSPQVFKQYAKVLWKQNFTEPFK